MESEVVAALIGGVAGLLGALAAFGATIASARRTLRSTLIQINAEHERAEAQIDAQFRTAEGELRARLEELKQSQLTELVKKRLQVYPELYQVISRNGRNWQLSSNPFDHSWASRFLEELIECNGRIGVYFSDDVYMAYGQLRDKLTTIREATRSGAPAASEDVEEVFAIIRNKYDGKGLGTYMKDDCGTFQFGSLVARSQAYEDTLRMRLQSIGDGEG